MAAITEDGRSVPNTTLDDIGRRLIYDGGSGSGLLDDGTLVFGLTVAGGGATGNPYYRLLFYSSFVFVLMLLWGSTCV